MGNRFNPSNFDKVRANIGRLGANVADRIGADGTAANMRYNADMLDYDQPKDFVPFYRMGSGAGGARDSAIPGATAQFSGSGSGSRPSAEDLAYLDSQEGALRRQYGQADNSLAQGLQSLIDSYTRNRNDANFQRGREIENLNLQEQDTTRKKDSAIDRVNTNARTLADSLRRKIGMASGADSSAYKITAPGAVAREASGERGDVMEDFGVNFRNLDLTKRRANEDFDRLLGAIEDDKMNRERQLRTGIEQQKMGIDEALQRVAAQRASGQGGAAVRAAMAPYEQQIAARDAAINDIFNKYRTAANFQPVKVDTPELRDYTVDRAAINANREAGTQDPYAPYRPQLMDDEEQFMV